jgi:hypothetical protein
VPLQGALLGSGCHIEGMQCCEIPR